MNIPTTPLSPHDRVLAQRNAEGWLFLAEALRGFRTTGAVAPSSRRLAAALAESLRAGAGQRLNVLEAGAGTGSVTRALLPLLGAGSRLDLVESNPRFAARLRERDTDDARVAARVRVRVHETYVEDFAADRAYDVIVSGLPFTNFAPGRVEVIMDRYLELLRPGGTLVYFSYAGTARARALFASRAEAARHRAVERLLAGYRRRYGSGFRTVWGNLPPAVVWQLRAPGLPAAPRYAPLPAASAPPASAADAPGASR